MEDSEKSNEIFISYRRADVEFTKKVYEELKKEQFTVWVDWDDIPPGVEGFTDEIQRGIEGAVAFLCILSPSYLASEYCLMELKEAIRLKKRVIPIVFQKFEPLPAPEGIGHINWVYFTPHAGQENTFEQSFPRVIQAIKADYEYSREHTKLFLRANDWQKNGKGKGYLLTTAELEKAERWQSTATGKDPPPTELHGEYILASRKDASRRQRTTLAGVSVALIVSVVLGIVAWFQKQAADTQATISRSGELAAQSVEVRDKNFQVSLLLGIEGYRKFDSLATRKALFDATNSSPVRQMLTLPQGSGLQGAFSPDGKIYASANADDSISLWDVTERKPIGKPLKGHRGAISTLIFSRDGKMLVSGGCAEPRTGTVCSKGEVLFWNVESQQLIGQPISDFGGGIGALALTPDGKELATINYQIVSVDSQTIIDSYSVVLWDTATHQPATNQPRWPEGVNPKQLIGYTLAMSKDGKTLAATITLLGTDGLIKNKEIILWNVETGEIVKQIQTNDTYFTGDSNQLILSPDGNTIIVGDWWGSTTLWDINSGLENTADGSLQDRSFATTSIALSADGKTLAVATFEQGGASEPAEGVINFWDMDSFKPVGSKLIGFHTDAIRTMTFSPDGNTLFSAGQSQVIVWNTPGPSGFRSEPLGKLIFTGSNDADPNNGMLMAFSPDGKTLAANSGTKSISLWDVGARTASQSGPQGRNFVYSPDSGTIASVDDKGIILWDVARKQSVELPIDTSNMTGIALGPNAKSLISYNSSSDKINIWDISNPDSFKPTSQSFAVGSGDKQVTIDSMALSPTGKILAVSLAGVDGNDWAITLWNMDTHQQIGEALLTGHDSNRILDLKFSADGSILASSDFTTTMLWDVATHRRIGQPFSGGDPVLSSDNTTLALINIPPVGVDYSGEISVWNIPTHQLLGQPLFDPHGLIGLVISPDAKTVASMGRGGEITLWDLNPDSWIDLNCQRVGRNFTRAEWTLYGFTDTYRKTCDQWPLDTGTVAFSTPNPTNANPTEDTSLATQPPSNSQALAATEPPTTAPIEIPVDVVISTETPPVEGAAPTEAPAATEVPTTSNTYTEEFDGNLDAWTRFMITGVDKQVDATLANGSLKVKLSPYQDKEPRVYWVNDSYTYTDVQVDMVMTNFGNNANGATLICQYSDLGWYGFTISNAGLYSIYGFDPNRVGDDRFVTLANGGSSAIKLGQATNTYTAVCKGNELSLYANGTLVKDLTDKTFDFTQGRAGFGVVSPLKLPVDLQLASISVSIPK